MLAIVFPAVADGYTVGRIEMPSRVEVVSVNRRACVNNIILEISIDCGANHEAKQPAQKLRESLAHLVVKSDR